MNLPTNTGIRTKRPELQQPANRRSFRELTRRYFAHETKFQSAIELVIFGIIVAISAWPILAAADALNKFLQTVT
jgi:hypothetical protein